MLKKKTDSIIGYLALDAVMISVFVLIAFLIERTRPYAEVIAEHPVSKILGSIAVAVLVIIIAFAIFLLLFLSAISMNVGCENEEENKKQKGG